MTLVSEGKSDYRIVVPDQATLVEQTAAREFQPHLAQVTGARLSIFSESKASHDKPRVVIGDATITRELLPGFSARPRWRPMRL